MPLEQVVGYWFDKVLEKFEIVEEKVPKDVLLQQKKTVQDKLRGLQQNFTPDDFFNALRIKHLQQDEVVIPCFWDIWVFKLFKGRNWTWEHTPLRGFYATYQIAQGKDIYQPQDEEKARAFWERNVKNSKDLRQDILYQFKKNFQLVSSIKRYWRSFGLPYRMSTSSHFYTEGIRFYTDNLQKPLETLFVHATTSGLVNPQEYYGSLYNVVRSRRTVPSWAKPGSLALNLGTTKVSDEEIERLEFFEYWSRALAEMFWEMRHSGEVKKNPARKIYFDSGIGISGHKVSYLLTKNTFGSYNAKEKALWKMVFQYFREAAGVQIYYIATPGFTKNFKELNDWTLFGIKDNRISGIVLKSERETEKKKISHGHSFLADFVIALSKKELEEIILELLAKMEIVVAAIVKDLDWILRLLMMIAFGTKVTKTFLKRRRLVLEKMDEIRKIAQNAREEAIPLSTWDQIEELLSVR